MSASSLMRLALIGCQPRARCLQKCKEAGHALVINSFGALRGRGHAHRQICARRPSLVVDSLSASRLRQPKAIWVGVPATPSASKHFRALRCTCNRLWPRYGVLQRKRMTDRVQQKRCDMSRRELHNLEIAEIPPSKFRTHAALACSAPRSDFVVAMKMRKASSERSCFALTDARHVVTREMRVLRPVRGRSQQRWLRELATVTADRAKFT